jgi:hypothetical protein
MQQQQFEDWFHELEGFACRSERFYSILSTQKDLSVLSKTMVDWLRAAYEQGKQDQSNPKIND